MSDQQHRETYDTTVATGTPPSAAARLTYNTPKAVVSSHSPQFAAGYDGENTLIVKNPYGTLMDLIYETYPPLVCLFCDQEFDSLSEERQHLSKVHASHKPFLCLHPHCEDSFSSRSSLRLHLKTCHLVEKVAYSSVTPATNTSPYVSATRASPAVSLSAAEEATTPVQINSPIEQLCDEKSTIANKNESDDVANKQQQQLVWRVAKISRTATYRAPRGSKKIVLSPSTEEMLNSVYHPLRCPSCNQMFRRKTNVIKHLATAHHGEEPYRCIFSDCDHPKLYATREGLVYHILRMHDSPSAAHERFKGHHSDTSSVDSVVINHVQRPQKRQKTTGI